MTLHENGSQRFRASMRSLGVFVLSAMLMLAGCDIFFGGNDDEPRDDGGVRAVVKAPVAPDGNVAGQTTDLVLNLDASLDPNEPGLALRAGDQIRVTLPAAFEKDQDLPLLNIFDCIPQFPQCDTAVLLLGWPQGALGAPPPLGYEVSYEGARTIVITTTEDHIPSPPSNPGLKQIHLLLNSFTNPDPGRYQIGVEVATDDGVAYGRGRARILSGIRPSIEVTNAFHEGFASGNFQETSPDSLTPLPFDFLLWDDEGAPFEGVTIEGNNLMQGDEVVGQVSTEAPVGTTGQEVFTEEASTRVDAPVTGVLAGHLRAFFRAGSATGEYVVTFELNGGNAVEMVVRVR